jgi:hypothetical protein
VAISTGALSGLFSNIPTPLAVAIGAAIGAVNYDLSTFCTTDPPAMPTLTLGNYEDIAGVNGTLAQLQAVEVFQQAVGNLLWPQLCECTSTTTPAAPSWPTPPSGLPNVNPTGTNTNPACYNQSLTYTVPAGTSSLVYPDLTQSLLPTTGTPVTGNNGVVGSFAGLSMNAYTIPASVTSITIQWNVTACDSSIPDSSKMIYAINWFDNAGNHLGGQSIAQNLCTGPYPITESFHPGDTIWPLNAARWSLYGRETTPPNTAHPQTTQFQMQAFCGGASGTAGCCPPDPNTTAQLTQAISLLQSIYQSLPTPVTSYATGTAHAGLSGNGPLTLSAAPLAVRVDITTDAATLGEDFGSPVYLFDRGYIVPIVNSAPVSGATRLVFNPQMYVLPALTEQIGYSLAPGVVITITELTAGP